VTWSTYFCNTCSYCLMPQEVLGVLVTLSIKDILRISIVTWSTYFCNTCSYCLMPKEVEVLGVLVTMSTVPL
jgi:hypothetical protein